MAKKIVITPALKLALELINRPGVEIFQLGELVRQSSSNVFDCTIDWFGKNNKKPGSPGPVDIMDNL